MAQTLTAKPTTALTTLISQIRAIVSTEIVPARIAAGVAEALSPALADSTLLDPARCEPDPVHYRQHVLHVEPDGGFSIVALVWLPGQATPIHDHVCWCVVGVYQGEEFETRYTLQEAGGTQWLTEVDTTTNPTGSIAALTPPGDIHRVANAGDGLAISLHIYGADIGVLGSSVRRRYDLDVHSADPPPVRA